MISLKEIITKFDQYTLGKVSVDDFEEWVLGNLQEILNSGDQAAIHLIDEADVLLMQFRDGHLTEKALIDSLNAVISEVFTLRDKMTVKEVEEEEELFVFSVDSETVGADARFNEAVSEFHCRDVVFG